MARSAYQVVLDEHRRRLARLIDRRGAAALHRVYDQAQAELLRKLAAVARRDSYTAYVHRLVLAQVRQGQVLIAQRLAGELGDLSREAQVEAVRGLGEMLGKLEERYRGVRVVLPIDEAARFAGIVDARRTSLLRQHQSSMARYGADLVGKMEGELQVALMTGETGYQAIDRVQATAENEWWQAERIQRTECLPGDTLISGAAMVRAVYRRFYDGPVIEIRTERGRKFRATPNHPMLTRRGWICTGSLIPMDDLICYCGHQHAGATRNQDVDDRPSQIVEIFDALAAVGIRERRRGANPDFHGDGSDREVDVLRPRRPLGIGCYAPISQPLAEEIFTPSHLARAACCPSCRQLCPINQRCSLCDAAVMNPRLLDTPSNRVVVHAESHRDLMCTFSAFVATTDLAERQIVAVVGGTAAPRNERMASIGERARHARMANDPSDDVRPDLETYRNLRGAQTGDIELDRVCAINAQWFHGWVFNLSTVDGYFTINGAYTGNTAWAANGATVDGIRAATEVLPDLLMQWSEHCDEEGRPLDERVSVDSIAMHGQVARPGDPFTMPATAPWPDKDGKTEVPRQLVGKQWEQPPNRPNDRATVTPWRRGWGVRGWRYVGGRRVSLT